MDMAIVDSADPAANAVGEGACRRSAMRRQRPRATQTPPTAMTATHHPSPPQRRAAWCWDSSFSPSPSPPLHEHDDKGQTQQICPAQHVAHGGPMLAHEGDGGGDGAERSAATQTAPSAVLWPLASLGGDVIEQAPAGFKTLSGSLVIYIALKKRKTAPDRSWLPLCNSHIYEHQGPQRNRENHPARHVPLGLILGDKEGKERLAA